MQGTTSARRCAALVTVAVLLLGVSACGSSDSAGGSDPTTTTSTKAPGSGSKDTTGVDGSSGTKDTTVDATGDSTGPGSGTETSAPADGAADGEGGPGGGGPCSPDADRLSGTSTVIWTADSASKHQASDATAKTTLLFQKDGSMKPSTLTVKVGEVFTFGLADGVSDIVSVKVGCDSGQTVLSGPALAAEYVTTPGTYDIVNVVANEQVGTITVE